MALNNTKQSTLEKKGIEERRVEMVRSDYGKKNPYSDSHEDALSHPDDPEKILGKGTNSGGHQHYTPDHSKPSIINYSNLNTTNGGGYYDIHGRNEQGGRDRLLKINIYGKTNPYGPDSVDTSANIDDGQYVIKM